jgi:hypothetical protein
MFERQAGAYPRRAPKRSSPIRQSLCLTNKH